MCANCFAETERDCFTGKNEMNIRVVLSTGNGRLHLVTSAKYLLRAGIDIRIIQGWVPFRRGMFIARWLELKFKIPSLAFGMTQRAPKELIGRIDSCSDAEFLLHFLIRTARLLPRHWNPIQKVTTLGWQFFGWASKRFIHNAEVYHVRSGAGQGGAIKLAKKRGMRVLVDHSAAHPGWMKDFLTDEYLRHGQELKMSIDNPFWEMIVKDCKDADLVMVNSSFVKETFVYSGYDEAKIRVVYLGVRSDFNGLRDWQARHNESKDNPLHIIFTGNFCFHKGAEYILGAISLLVRRNIRFLLTIVGSTTTALSILSKYSELSTFIRLVGQVPQDDLKKYLAESDIYLFPSLAEGCAQSGMEAMSAGLCVVATRESGLPIIDGETGFLIPSMDEVAIAERIEWLVNNPNEMKRVGRNATKQLAVYTWEKYAENVVNVYKELTARNVVTF